VGNELMAATKEANAALWRYCFDVDRITATEALKRPVDDPLPWMLADPRRLQRSTRDGLWVRLIDVGASLALRHYMQSDRLVLEVRDDLCPWNNGRFELEGSAEGAICRASSSSPDLVLAVSSLASAYLGAVSFSTLSQAGLVDERSPGALLRADRMFAVQHQPWTPTNF
ncbi:MAG: sterol carrier protein domain-containing protein, partial [Chloroflexi bacterium]|nr:sterol carrier protein domain-containing protein [Chloroflexota bacterium]